MTKKFVNIEELSKMLGIKKETLRRNCAAGTLEHTVQRQGKYKIYSIMISSLSQSLQDKFFAKFDSDQKDLIAIGAELYANAPAWSKKQADKYLQLISMTEKLTHKECKIFIAQWNHKNKDDKSKQISYSSLARAKKIFKKEGVAGLLSQHGTRKGKNVIRDIYFDYFKSLYLKEGSPSALTCWHITFGYAKSDENIKFENFPSCKAFERRLKKEIPEQAIFLARYGQSAWNRKYASYIPRDYSKVFAGAYWAEWMVVHKGKKVYLRRDDKSYQDAWVFDALNEEFLGKAECSLPVAFSSTSDIEKNEFKKAVGKKKKEKKILQEYISTKFNPSNFEIVENLKRGLSRAEFIAEPKISKISNTKMDEVVKGVKNEKLAVEPKYKTEIEEPTKLYLTESEKRRARVRGNNDNRIIKKINK